ncbi:MAG: Leucinerich repeat protein-like protein [Flavipsychrobacter sp.]|jgi:internalin A|nr:Leucinerich repeat protein-like protein [Flavipsychrobacter sp.]
MKMLWLLLFVLLPVVGVGQVITTVAGTGVSTFSGDGSPATAAGIPNPRGSVFDRHGNYYFTDGSPHRVRKIDAAGIITTVAGNGMGGFAGDGGPATGARLYLPVAVTFDAMGNMFIADIMNYRIRRVDVTTGNISTIAGNGTAIHGGDGGLATAATLTGPNDVCFDKWGNLYISDHYWIRKVNPSGVISTIAGVGTAGSSGDGGPATNAQIYGSTSVACDTNGNVYIAERTGNRVRKVNTAGIITTFAGNGSPTYLGDGIPATNAQIVPNKLGFDSLMQLYIADDYNERIFRVDAGGITHHVAGNGTIGFSGDGGPATAAAIQLPAGIAFDLCGNLFFPDAFNRRIRKVTFNPACNPTLETKQINPPTEISIYPNPASTELTISAPGGVKEVSVWDLIGREMTSPSFDYRSGQASPQVERGTLCIDISSLPPGVYFVRMVGEDGGVAVRRFVKE